MIFPNRFPSRTYHGAFGASTGLLSFLWVSIGENGFIGEGIGEMVWVMDWGMDKFWVGYWADAFQWSGAGSELERTSSLKASV